MFCVVRLIRWISLLVLLPSFPRSVHVGRSDVWDKRAGGSKLSKGNNFQYDRARLPVGFFDLELLGHTVLEGAMRLSLWDAVVQGEVRTERGSVSFEAYAHARRPVLVVKVTRCARAGFVRTSTCPSLFSGKAERGQVC